MENNSTKFNAGDSSQYYKTAIYAGGCFWGMQYYFEKAKGVVKSVVGYTGGHLAHPTYREVCNHTTGHYEAIEVTYDTRLTNYEEITRYFFDIHDPTQADGQGPDIGEQYQSVIFYVDDAQKKTAEKLIGILTGKGFIIATQLKKVAEFWPAEDYHQFYYDKEGATPYCHRFVDRFK